MGCALSLPPDFLVGGGRRCNTSAIGTFSENQGKKLIALKLSSTCLLRMVQKAIWGHGYHVVALIRR